MTDLEKWSRFKYSDFWSHLLYYLFRLRALRQLWLLPFSLVFFLCTHFSYIIKNINMITGYQTPIVNVVSKHSKALTEWIKCFGFSPSEHISWSPCLSTSDELTSATWLRSYSVKSCGFDGCSLWWLRRSEIDTVLWIGGGCVGWEAPDLA